MKSTGTCERPRFVARSEACTDSTRHCGPEDVCWGASVSPDGGVGTSGRCEERTLGRACRTTSDCPRRAFCDAAGQCAAAGEGTPCRTRDEYPDSHLCAEDKTCRAKPGLGEVCSVFDGCASPFACAAPREVHTGVCIRPLAGEGEACNADAFSACISPFGCVNGRCVEVGTKGHPCNGYGYCYTGACEGRDGTLHSGTCVDPLPEGATCSFGRECASGACEVSRRVAACG